MDASTKCEATKSQIVRRLNASGCKNVEHLDYQQLCRLNAVYNDTVQPSKTKIPQSEQSYFDATFAQSNLAYLRYSSEQIQECKIEIETLDDLPKLIGSCFESKQSFERCLFPRVASARDLQIQTQFHCIIRDILERSTNFGFHNVPKSKSRGIKVVTELLHRFIDPIKLISTGQFSKVYIGSLRKLQIPFVVIKTSADESKAKYIPGIVLHELAVGYALNTIRKLTGSSFTYFYGGFYCGSTTAQYSTSLNSSKQPSTTFLCNTFTPEITSFSIQQLIPNGVTLTSLLSSATIQSQTSSFIFDFCHKIFIQVAQALSIAQDQLNFVHFDLHGNNVLITPTIAYDLRFKFGSRSYDINNITSFVTLIDYGHSVCTVKMGSPYNETVLNNCWPVNDPNNNVIVLGSRATTTNEYFLPLLDLFRYITFELAVNYGKFGQSVDAALTNLRSVWLGYIKRLFTSQNDRRDNRYVKWMQIETMSTWVGTFFSQNIGFVLVEDAELFKLSTLSEWMNNVEL
jgi:hypothetical protein